jgi:hypothetical protein
LLTFITIFRKARGRRGPWNAGEKWKFIADVKNLTAVDSGDGTASVKLKRPEKMALEHVAARRRTGFCDPLGKKIDTGLGPGTVSSGGGRLESPITRRAAPVRSLVTRPVSLSPQPKTA